MKILFDEVPGNQLELQINKDIDTKEKLVDDGYENALKRRKVLESEEIVSAVYREKMNIADYVLVEETEPFKKQFSKCSEKPKKLRIYKFKKFLSESDGFCEPVVNLAPVPVKPMARPATPIVKPVPVKPVARPVNPVASSITLNKGSLGAKEEDDLTKIFQNMTFRPIVSQQ